VIRSFVTLYRRAETKCRLQAVTHRYLSRGHENNHERPYESEAKRRFGDRRASRRTVLRRGAAVVGTVGSAGCARSGPPAGENPEPALVAHRGCGAENPENTAAAVEAAAGVADAVEVDVRRCETGTLVAFHDERLDRLTAETGRVDETPCGTVVDLEVGGSGETVPTLRAVFEAVPPGVRVVLDLKEAGLAADALALHAEYGHDLLVSSFRRSVVATIREVDPAVQTAYIVRESPVNRTLRPVIPGLPSWLYPPEDVAGLVGEATGLGCDAIHPRYELCLGTDLVDRAHAAGLRVEPWTITTEREFDALRAAGVDGVITDVCRGLVGSE